MIEADKIREMYSAGLYTHRSLAKIFNIGKTNVGEIILNKKWSK